MELEQRQEEQAHLRVKRKREEEVDKEEHATRLLEIRIKHRKIEEEEQR